MIILKINFLYLINEKSSVLRKTRVTKAERTAYITEIRKKKLQLSTVIACYRYMIRVTLDDNVS